ncbi:unnamed protein product [Diamesa hyperborea]
MPLFEKCCCFFRLTTGGLILGWLGAVESVVMLFLTIFGMVNVEGLMKQLRNETSSPVLHSIDITNSSEGTAVFKIQTKISEMTDDEYDVIKNGLYVVFAIYLIVNCVTLISSILLITGSIVRNSLYLIPWLAGEAICLVFSCAGGILQIGQLLLTHQNLLHGIGYVIIILFLTGVEVYLYLCVYSLFQMLKREEKVRKLQLNEMQQPREKEMNDGLPAYSSIA